MSDRTVEQLTIMMQQMSDKMDNYIKADEEWKKNVTPSIDTMKQMQGFSVGVIWVMKFVGLLAVSVGAVYAFIKFIKN